MKKIVISLFVLFILYHATVATFAKEVKSVYVVKNTSTQQVIKEIKQQFDNISFNEKNDTAYSIENNLYFKAYKNMDNVEMFIYSQNEDVLSGIEKLSNKIYRLEDKATFKKYNDDFILFASSNNFDNIKSKKENKKGYDKYNPYMGKLRNEVLETVEISQDNIKIERKKLKPKAKVKHYAYGYEYTVANNTGKDIIIKNVASSGFIGLSQIAAYTLIPRGMDFVPVYGLVYDVQSDLEKNKFTRPHPNNKTIKKDETIRILALSKKQENPVADFTFIIDDKEILIKL